MNRNILRLLLSAAFVICCTFPALADRGVHQGERHAGRARDIRRRQHGDV